MSEPATHFAVPVFDTSGEPAEPYECQRCGQPIQPDGSGWAHGTADGAERSPAPLGKGHGGG